MEFVSIAPMGVHNAGGRLKHESIEGRKLTGKKAKKKRSKKQLSRAAKDKGRSFVKQVIEKLLENTDLEPGDIIKPTGSATGKDIIFSPKAQEIYPFAIECKCQEKLNIFKALEQAEKNVGRDETMLTIFKKNFTKTYVAMDVNDFLNILHRRSGNGL